MSTTNNTPAPERANDNGYLTANAGASGMTPLPTQSSQSRLTPRSRARVDRPLTDMVRHPESTQPRKNSSASSSHRLIPSRKSSRNKLSKEDLRKERRPSSASSKGRDVDSEAHTRRRRSNLDIPDDHPSTNTGLSGETAQGSSHSLRIGSKSSKRSLTGRRRAGSTASSKRSQRLNKAMSEKQPQSGTPDSGSPRTLTGSNKKKGGFLSFLCCTKAPEDDESFAAKPVKTKPERTSAVAKPETAESSTAESREPLNEKTEGNSFPAPPQAVDSDTSAGTSFPPAIGITRAPSNREKPQPPIPGQLGQLDTTSSGANGGPSIAVQAPTPVSPDGEQLIHDRTASQEQLDTDIEMTDAGASVPISTNDVQTADDVSGAQPLHKDASQVKIDLPPPPPLAERQAQVTPPEITAGHGQPEPQKWLLPAVRPEHKGRKCLVLDLDETLVHSSFKVCASFACVRGENANDN